MTGPILPSRQMATDPAEQAPPAPWLRFYVRFVEVGSGRYTSQRMVTALTDRELAWVGRTVAAELTRRQENVV